MEIAWVEQPLLVMVLALTITRGFEIQTAPQF